MNSQLRILHQKVLQKLKTVDGHWLFTGHLTGNGNGYIPERIDGKVYRHLTQRIVWQYYNGHTSKNLRNLCGHKNCVKPDHWRVT